MKATDPRYHVGLGIHIENEWQWDRSASLADLWAIVLWNLIRHPIRSTILSRRYMSGQWEHPTASTDAWALRRLKEREE